MIEISAYAVKYDQLRAAIFQFIGLNNYQAYYQRYFFKESQIQQKKQITY